MTGGKRKRDFTQTTSTCLSFIHEALLKHQWQRAAEYMHSYLQTLEDSDTYKRQAAPEVGVRRKSAGRSRLLGVLLLALPTEAFCFPCLCFLSPGVGGVHHHARLTPSFTVRVPLYGIPFHTSTHQWIRSTLHVCVFAWCLL